MEIMMEMIDFRRFIENKTKKNTLFFSGGEDAMSLARLAL